MQTYKFSELTLPLVKSIVEVRHKGVVMEFWDRMTAPFTERERLWLDLLTADLRGLQLHRMNEATVWARAIYPLLHLAERPGIQAWAEVELKATYQAFSLMGMVDGVLAAGLSGQAETPYLIVHEAKKGIDATDPQYQLYGEMLAAAWLNYQENHLDPQEIFGCYTISDSWSFVHGTVAELESERPLFTVVSSREYTEKLEADAILQILKTITAKSAMPLEAAAA